MHRLLRREDLAGDRRLQQRHSAHATPSLVATGPNQIWTWDITKLKAPGAGIVPYAYAIIDMYSRAVVGWMVAERESEILAAEDPPKWVKGHEDCSPYRRNHVVFEDHGGPAAEVMRAARR